MLANQVPDVLPCLGPPVVHGGGEDQAEDGLHGPSQSGQTPDGELETVSQETWCV